MSGRRDGVIDAERAHVHLSDQRERSGMTVLQAMTAGAMLVTTKLGANFEVAGMVPFYCEPDNSYSLLQVLHRMLDESPKSGKSAARWRTA